MTEEAIEEAAFRIYRRNLARSADERSARARFEHAPCRDEFVADAREAARVCDVHRTGEDWSS